MNWLIIDEIIKNALKEDISDDDISTRAIFNNNSKANVDLICKEDGIVAGLPVFERVFKILEDVTVKFYKNEGDKVYNKELIAVISGSTDKILMGERVALNLLQHLSGIATFTAKFVEKLEGTSTKLLDTRKTTPNLRVLEKYAVRVGGGTNHRFNLSDGVMLKDNHIAAAGGIKNAVAMAKASSSFVRKIEVETESLDMVKEALEAKADIIMLDNMSLEDMKKAVELIDGRALTEASGNVTLETIRSIAETGVDYISSGALTHSFSILDFSMKNLKVVD